MKRIFFLMLLAASLAMPIGSASAQEATTSAQDELISLVGKAIVEETTQASEEVRKAKEILDVVLDKGTQVEKEKAERDMERAQERYRTAEKKLDTARVEAIADQCGKSPAEIQAMRDSGMGWGNIAKACGIHPSVNGKGNSKSKGKDADSDKGKGSSKSKSKGKDTDSDKGGKDKSKGKKK